MGGRSVDILVIGELRIPRGDIVGIKYDEEKVIVAEEEYIDMFWGLRMSRGFIESQILIRVLSLLLTDGEEWFFHDSSKFLASTKIFQGMPGGEVNADRVGLFGAYWDMQSRKQWRYMFDLDPVLADLDSFFPIQK